MIEKKNTLCNSVECCVPDDFWLDPWYMFVYDFKRFKIKGVVIGYEGKA